MAPWSLLAEAVNRGGSQSDVKLGAQAVDAAVMAHDLGLNHPDADILIDTTRNGLISISLQAAADQDDDIQAFLNFDAQEIRRRAIRQNAVDQIEQARAAAGKNLTFGIRPEHLEDVTVVSPDAQTGAGIEATADVVEYLGNELLVYMTVNGKQVVARLNPRSEAHPGGRIRLHVDTDQIHLFNTDTGEGYF